MGSFSPGLRDNESQLYLNTADRQKKRAGRVLSATICLVLHGLTIAQILIIPGL